MTPVIKSLFDEADSRYLKSPALKEMTTYVTSLNDRVVTYRLMRDREISVMQTVANQLTDALPNEPIARIEKSITMAILVLRHSSMAMLTGDVDYAEERFLPWLRESTDIHGTQMIDAKLYPALLQQLSQVFNDRQMSLIRPYVEQAQQALVPNLVPDSTESLLTVAGLF